MCHIVSDYKKKYIIRYGSKMSIKNISENIRVSRDTVARVMKDAGVEKFSPKKKNSGTRQTKENSTVQEGFFDVDQHKNWLNDEVRPSRLTD